MKFMKFKGFHVISKTARDLIFTRDFVKSLLFPIKFTHIRIPWPRNSCLKLFYSMYSYIQIVVKRTYQCFQSLVMTVMCLGNRESGTVHLTWRGGGAIVFWGILQHWWKKFLSLTWTENNTLKALYALKNIVFIEKKK